MKRFLLISLFIIFFFSCGSDKKQKENTGSQESIIKYINDKNRPKESVLKYNFKVVNNLFEDPGLVSISDKLHTFDNVVSFDGVYAIKIGNDTYSLLLEINAKETDFEQLEKWKLGVYIYPQNPTLFKEESNRVKGFRTFGALTTPVLTDNHPFILVENFDTKPKEFKSLRFYLYGNQGIINNDFYIINEVLLP